MKLTPEETAARAAMIKERANPKASRYSIVRAGTDAVHEVMGYQDRLKAWAIASEVYEGMLK